MPSLTTANQIDNIAPADNLKVGADRYNAHWHEYDALTLTNRTGGSLGAGDVVALDTAADASAVLDNTVSAERPYVVAMATIANLATGEFARGGLITSVKATGSIARGEYVRKSATTKTVESAGVTIAATSAHPPLGTLGVATKAAAAGVVDVLWFDKAQPPLDFEPEQDMDFAEDFFGTDSTGAIAAAVVSYTHPWFVRTGDLNGAASLIGGAVRISGDGTAIPYATLGRGATPLMKMINRLKNPTYQARVAQAGSAAGTRFFGLSDNATLTADPANGIYFRFSNGANLIAVCRIANVETVVDTGVSIGAAGSFHTARLVVSGGGTSVQAWVDGQPRGSAITTNIPTVDLLPGMGGGAATSGEGLDVDYVRVRATR